MNNRETSLCILQLAAQAHLHVAINKMRASLRVIRDEVQRNHPARRRAAILRAVPQKRLEKRGALASRRRPNRKAGCTPLQSRANRKCPARSTPPNTRWKPPPYRNARPCARRLVAPALAISHSLLEETTNPPHLQVSSATECGRDP